MITKEAIDAGLRITLSSVNMPAGECLHETDVREILEAALPFLPIAGKPDMLRLAVAAVLEADKEFRANMPPEWEGDPLSDEIDGLRRVFSALSTQPASTALVERAAAFDQIVAARKAHVDAVSTYNARLEFVRAERMRGSWLTVDKEYAASTEAERSYLRITRELADAALSASQPTSREGEQ